MNEHVLVREEQLERMHLVLEYAISKALINELAERPQVELIEDVVVPAIVARIRLSILGREMERIECRYPATWWEAVRKRWWPAWAKRRWPIRYETKELVARELYPKVAIPRFSPIIALTLGANFNGEDSRGASSYPKEAQDA